MKILARKIKESDIEMMLKLIPRKMNSSFLKNSIIPYIFEISEDLNDVKIKNIKYRGVEIDYILFKNDNLGVVGVFIREKHFKKGLYDISFDVKKYNNTHYFNLLVTNDECVNILKVNKKFQRLLKIRNII